MRGASKETVSGGFGFILLILTAILFYLIFAPSECDAKAQLSADEIRRAIECVANTDGIDPITGKPCNSAVVKLCQQGDATIGGFDYIAGYLGLMNPEYLIYYKEFPKKDVTDSMAFAPFFVEWSDSYPIERASTGHRMFDVIIPSFTQFKEFFRTKYLEEPCTDETALCFNMRGQENLYRISAPINKVKINRDLATLSLGIGDNDIFSFNVGDLNIKVDENPTFHLISPCYAKVKFEKDGDDIIAKLDKCSTDGDTSNYCFADKSTINSAIMIYEAETICFVLETIFTGGTNLAIKASTMGLKTLGIPGAGMEPCRQGAALLEAKQFWPGFPGGEMTVDDMAGACKPVGTASEIFEKCCFSYVYGGWDKPDEFACTEPSHLVKLVKEDIIKDINTRTTEEMLSQNMTLTDLAKYLDVPVSNCNLVETDNTKSCLDAIEVKAQNFHLTPECGSLSTHTFNFGKIKEASKMLLANIVVGKEECNSRLIISTSLDNEEWVELAKADVVGYPEVNQIKIKSEIDNPIGFKYVRISEQQEASAEPCGITNSFLVIDPLSEALPAVTNTEYDLYPMVFNYFIVPDNYVTTASKLCDVVEKCISISKGTVIEGTEVKYYKGYSQGTDFELYPGDRVGIMASEQTSIIFIR
jgi:hypothetical protein